MKSSIRILLCLGLALASALPAAAQIQMARSVFGNGGGMTAGPNNALHATLGQPNIGRIGGPAWLHHIGFWAGGRTPSAIDEAIGLPTVYRLGQNQPNPFYPATTIRFAVPEPTRASIRLYDIRGRLERVLLDGSLEAGFHQVVLNAGDLPSGIYFYRMEARGFGDTKKLILLR